MSEPTFNDNAYQIAKQTITELRADLSEALEGLGPFRKLFERNKKDADQYGYKLSDGDRPKFLAWTDEDGKIQQLTIGDLRRAAAVVAKHQGGADD